MQLHVSSPEPSLVISEQLAPALRSLATRAQHSAPDLAERLLHEIDRADIVPAADVPSDVVALGSFVTYRDESAGSVRTIRIVLPHEADVARGRVSVVTPIGVALIGLKPGQQIEYALGQDERRLVTVLNVFDVE